MDEITYELPTVVEWCPHCETEIEMRWDVKKMGYQAYCPVCGEILMLCDECKHRGEDGAFKDDCDWDSETKSCKWRKKPKHIQREDKKYRVWITKALYGAAYVEAVNKQEAVDKMMELYRSDGIEWHSSEILDISPEEE